MAAIAYPPVPRSVELDAETKRRVLAGVKTVLERLRQRGLVPADLEYGQMLGRPQALHAAIRAFRSDPAVAADLAVDAGGRPAADDDAPLACGPSLAQIVRMLVFTCARRMFVEAGPDTKRKDGAGAPKSEGERKLAALEPWLAFDWQLPLLKLYYFFLDRHQLAEVGRDLLLLRDPAALEVVASFDVAAMRAARHVVGPLFSEMLLENPAAIGGLAGADPRDFAFFRRVLGHRAWAFYARDRDYLDDVGEVDRERVEAMAPVLPVAAIEAVRALARLRPERIAQMLEGFAAVFGADATADLCAEPAVARQTLAAVVERFETVDRPPEEFVELVALKCTALKGPLAPWLEKRRRTGEPG